MPMITPQRSARLPLTLDQLLAGGDADPTLVGRTPIDVVMARAKSQAWFGQVEESNLARAFTLPRGRTYRVYGVAAAAPGTGEDLKVDGDGCLVAGTLDERALRVRPLDRDALRADEAWLFSSCGSQALTAGKHEFIADEDVIIDTVTFRDRIGEELVSPTIQPTATVLSQTPDHLRVLVQNPAGLPMWLSTGMASDPGWQATLAGSDLGQSTVLDGYAMSWQLTGITSGVVDIRFEPQQWAELTRWVSLVGLVGCLVLAGLARRRPPIEPSARVRRWSRTRCAVAAGAWTCLTLPAGPVGLLAAAVAGLVVLSGLIPRRGWYRLSLLAIALAPVAWILGNAERWGSVTAALVYDNQAAGWAAWFALTTCAIGLAVGAPPQVEPEVPTQEPVGAGIPQPEALLITG